MIAQPVLQSQAPPSSSIHPILQQPYPSDAYTAYKNRPIRGIVLHHTATKTLANPGLGRSWHYIIDRNPGATIYKCIPVTHAAHHVGQCDLWVPAWVVECPNRLVSNINYSSVGIELVCSPQAPDNQFITPAQHDALYYLFTLLYSTYGPLPIIGHGQVDSSRWPSEPHSLIYPNAGVLQTPVWNVGRYFSPFQEDPDNVNPIDDTDLQKYLESYGTRVNMSTAIIKRAALSYRRGETRGPAISDEYSYGPIPTVRQRFTAGTCEYNPTTGGCGWVELNIDPELPVT